MSEGTIINGEIVMWDDGVLRPVRPFRAWLEWLGLVDSPVPQSRERARTIRAALDRIGASK